MGRGRERRRDKEGRKKEGREGGRQESHKGGKKREEGGGERERKMKEGKKRKGEKGNEEKIKGKRSQITGNVPLHCLNSQPCFGGPGMGSLRWSPKCNSPGP